MPTSLPSADIFTRISDASEKNRLFRDLANSKEELVSKKPDPSSDIILLMAYDYSNEKIHCKVLEPHLPLAPKGALILTCFVGGEKYFFQADFQSVGDQVTLMNVESVYHLQRREDYRIRVPSTYKALFEIVSVNGKVQKLPIPILDLSGGGCRIQVDPTVLPLKLHDMIKGHLFLPDRAPIQVTATVRHIKTDHHNKGPILCGLHFEGHTEPVKNRIVAVVMDLYREFFAGRT